ncbi:thermonuclease family protein [Eikenella sp. NML99-0057]|uniref:thermonuclease family protein n=1 Tax=Eikenella sp. NML99-0057 TaxID=1795834 RepID=UPI002101B075|nr:thermonuclease family protein [Eikenella sp. NML99-0057]
MSFCGAKTNAAGFVKIGMAGYAMLLAACSTLPASAEPARNNIISGEVVRAWDGDTLHLQDHRSGQRHKLRLAGIDAPELEQAQGKACRDRLAEQVLHRQVQAEIVDTDRYGRKVRTNPPKWPGYQPTAGGRRLRLALSPLRPRMAERGRICRLCGS